MIRKVFVIILSVTLILSVSACNGEKTTDMNEKVVVAEAAQMNTLTNVNKELEEAAKSDQQMDKDIKTDKKDGVSNDEKKDDVEETVQSETTEDVEEPDQENVTYTHVDIRL